MLVLFECSDWIHAGTPPRREDDRHRADNNEERRDSGHCEWIHQAHLEQQAGYDACDAKGDGQSNDDTNERQTEAVAEHEPHNLVRERTDRDADTDLACPLDHHLTDHGIQAQRSEDHRQKTEQA
jgi:hypothetical protein